MFWVDWRLTFIALIPFPLIIISTYYFKESINRSFFKVQRGSTPECGSILPGCPWYRLFLQKKESLSKHQQRTSNANIRAIFAYSVFFPWRKLYWHWQSAQLSGGPPEALHLQKQQGTVIALFFILIYCFTLRVLADKFNVLQRGLLPVKGVKG
jgi:ATP-binding cassette subfamily B protein